MGRDMTDEEKEEGAELGWAGTIKGILKKGGVRELSRGLDVSTVSAPVGGGVDACVCAMAARGLVGENFANTSRTGFEGGLPAREAPHGFESVLGKELPIYNSGCVELVCDDFFIAVAWREIWSADCFSITHTRISRSLQALLSSFSFLTMPQ